MPSDRFQQIVEAFHAARDLAPEKRADFLNQRLGQDPELRGEVESLLAADGETAGFIEPPAQALATGGLLPDAPLPSLVGKRIGAFTLTRLIAAGGMGAVYEADQDHPRRQVAVKVMKAGLTSAEALKRFGYESEILARLRHPGIAQVFEAGTFDDGTGPVPYFAMELIPDATDLVAHAEVRDLGIQARLQLFTRVCEAVHHGHQKGVIHRDLKPANILVDAAGNPKIIDFGVARATDLDVAATTLHTQVGQIMGTLQYMSPEQWQADPGDLDTRSDVYALGMVLYELLSGKLPYDLTRAAIHEAARIVVEEPPRRPSTFLSLLRGDLETIILKALEKDRRRRYPSAADLGRDIHRYMNHEPIEARPPSLGYQLRMFALRNRALFAALVATFLILTAATGISITFAVQANQARTAEAERARSEIAARARADGLFEKGRTLARFVIFDFLGDLQKISGATRAEERLTRKILDYLDGLSREEGSDPGLERELAIAYQRMAGVLGGQDQKNLGDTRGALESYKKALAIYERLEATEPKNPRDRRNQAHLIRKIGNVLALGGDKAGAMKKYEVARARFEMLLDEATNRAPILRDLSFCSMDIGTLHKVSGRLEAAREEFRKVLALFEATVAAHPEDRIARRDLAIAHSLIGEIQEMEGNFEAAKTSYRKFMKYAEASRGKMPSSTTALRDVSVACIAAGDLFARTEDPESALKSFQKAVEIRKAVAAANPADVQARRDLAVAHQRLSNIHQFMKKLPEALVHAEKSLEIMENLVRTDPRNVGLNHSLWISQDLMGSILVDSGRTGEALPHLRKALEVARTMVKQDPANTVHRQGVAQAYLDLGNIHLQRPGKTASTDEILEEFRQAVSWFEKSRKALEEIGEFADLTADQKSLIRSIGKKIDLVEGSIRKLEALEKRGDG